MYGLLLATHRIWASTPPLLCQGDHTTVVYWYFFFCFSLLQTSIFILVLQIFAWLPQSRLNAISWWNFGHGIFQGSLYFYGLLLLWRNRLASFKVACTAYVTPWLLSAATFTFNEYKKQQYLIKAIFWCMFVVQFQLSSLKNLKNVKYTTNTFFFIIFLKMPLLFSTHSI